MSFISALAKNFQSSLTGLPYCYFVVPFTITRVSEKINKNFLKIDIITYIYTLINVFVSSLL